MEKKFLIIQTASIGDVILATPLIESFRQAYPHSRIDFLLKKGCEGLFENHPHLNSIFVWDKNKGKYQNLFKILKQVRKIRYDFLLNLQRFGTTGMLSVFSNAKTVIGFDKNPFSYLYDISIEHKIGASDAIHEIDRNLMLIEKVCQPVRKVKLYPTDVDFRKVEEFKLKKYICIAPGSLWLTKRFPKEKWIEFINLLPRDVGVVLIGSRADETLCNEILNQSTHENIVNLSGKLSLLETAALMSSATMNYTNDSAPMHLCSAMDAPVAAVFCSTVPAFGFTPLSTKSFIIEAKEKLSCRPCGLHGHDFCPEKHFKCANDIKTEQLLSCLNI